MKRLTSDELQLALSQSMRGLMFENWGTKALAFLLAMVVFVATRDEISRTFRVPLEVRHDPDRKLLTQLPQYVDVEVRGPWARINRMTKHELNAAKLDLRDARPGPLDIDPATIVMPAGVVLGNRDLGYDRVDLRFDPYVSRTVNIDVQFAGEVHPDCERVAVAVNPSSWKLRAPSELMNEVGSLPTTGVEMSAVCESFARSVRLIEPPEGVQFVGVAEGVTPRVRVTVSLRPKSGSRVLQVPVAGELRKAELRGELKWPDADEAEPGKLDFERLPARADLNVSGPVRLLRKLANLQSPLNLSVRVDGSLKGPRGPSAILQIRWAEHVPSELQRNLVFSPVQLTQPLHFLRTESQNIRRSPDRTPESARRRSRRPPAGAGAGAPPNGQRSKPSSTASGTRPLTAPAGPSADPDTAGPSDPQ